MKIGIFGDSFAERMSKHSWCEKLVCHLDADFDNFGLAGSDLYYSYNLFRENYKNYDLNIFIATGSSRTSYFDWNRDEQKLNHVWMQKGGVDDSVDWNRNLFNYEMSSADKRIHKNNLFEWAHYTHVDVVKHLAIYDSLQFLDPNVIRVNAFDETDERCMSNITKIDYEYHRRQQGPENIEIRPNHMSVVQNEKFAKYLYHHIRGKRDILETMVWDNIKDFYPVTKNLHECGFDG